jgi:6-phosphogluconolactonase
MAERVIRANDEEVALEAAERWKTIATQAVAENGRFSVALAGGSTPRTLYRMLTSERYRDELPWGQTHVFWGDERRVPPDDERSNYHMARELLLDHVPIPPGQIHPMDGMGLSRGAMRSYERTLRDYFQYGRREMPRFDLILLGMGGDGHTASIFPGTRAVSDRSHKVLVYQVPQLETERITLTLPVINAAKHILIMVVGSAKAETLAEVLDGPVKTSTYPIQAVEPVDGQLTWLLDKAAAAELDSVK